MQCRHGLGARHPGLLGGEQTCVRWCRVHLQEPMGLTISRAICLQVTCRTAIWMGGRAGWRQNFSPLELGRPISDQLRHTQLGEQLTEAHKSYSSFTAWKSGWFYALWLSLAIQNHRAVPQLPAMGIQRESLKEKLKWMKATCSIVTLP